MCDQNPILCNRVRSVIRTQSCATVSGVHIEIGKFFTMAPYRRGGACKGLNVQLEAETESEVGGDEAEVADGADNRSSTSKDVEIDDINNDDDVSDAKEYDAVEDENFDKNFELNIMNSI